MAQKRPRAKGNTCHASGGPFVPENRNGSNELHESRWGQIRLIRCLLGCFACVFFWASCVYAFRMGAITDLIMGPLDGESGALAQALRERDPDTLDLLIERYHYRLLRYLLSLTRSRETAEDIFQETWIRVLERGYQYNGRSRFDTWLFSIARHLVIDRLRREHPHASLETLFDLDEGRLPGSVDTVPGSAHDLVSRREAGEQVAAALEILPATHREALLLRYQEEMSLEEIAQVSSAPLSTVKSRIYRGLELLRETLDGERV